MVQNTIRWVVFLPDALERQKPCRLRHRLGPVAPDGLAPFGACCLMMGANNRAVDHLDCVLHCFVFVQGAHDLLAEPRQCSTPKLRVNAEPLPKFCRGGSRNGAPVRAVPKTQSRGRRWLVGLRPFEARTVRMNRSIDAHSSSDTKSRAKLISIAGTSLDRACHAVCIPFANKA